MGEDSSRLLTLPFIEAGDEASGEVGRVVFDPGADGADGKEGACFDFGAGVGDVFGVLDVGAVDADKLLAGGVAGGDAGDLGQRGIEA